MTTFTKEDLDEFIQFCRHGDADAVKYYIQFGMDVNYKGPGGNTGLHMAAANGEMEVVEILLNHGATILKNDSGNTALHWAVENGHKNVVERLIKVAGVKAIDKNEFGKDAIAEAIRNDHGEITQILLDSVQEGEIAEATADVMKEDDGEEEEGAEGEEDAEEGGSGEEEAEESSESPMQ